VIIVASLNLAYFGVEFAVAVAIGSVSLFADSIDFLEDTSVNLLIAVALGWSALTLFLDGPTSSSVSASWPSMLMRPAQSGTPAREERRQAPA